MVSPTLRSWSTAATTDRDRPLLFTFSGVVRYVPLLVSGGFFAGTVLLLALGPIDWQLARAVPVYAFVTVCGLALAAGYAWSVRRPGRSFRAPARGRVHSASTLVVVGAAAYLLLFPFVSLTTTGTWYPDVYTGLTDAGAAYARNKELNETAVPVALYARMLVAPLTVLLFPLTLFFWPRLSTAARCLGTLCVVLSLALSIAQGINRGVAEICAYALLFLALVAAASLRKGRRLVLLRSLVGMVLVVGLFGAYYSATLNSRVASDQESTGAVRDAESKKAADVDDAMSTNALQGVAVERTGNLYFRVVPDAVQGEGLALISYLTHGFNGLSMAMGENFTPTYGLGFSEFYRHNLLRVAGQSEHEEQIEARTYAGKVTEDGWPDGDVWSTFFIHPASDIGFPGVVVLCGLIGFGFGLAWRDALTRFDPLACGVMFHFSILVFYFSANNQLFQGGELALGFTGLLVAWIVLRRGPRREGSTTGTPRPVATDAHAGLRSDGR